MNTVIADFLIGISSLAIVLGIPFAIFVYPRRPLWPRNLYGRIFLTVLIVWILLIIHRVIPLPFEIRKAEANGNPGYDGIGGNLAILFCGWIMGFIGCLPALVIRTFWNWIASRDRARRRSNP